MASIKSFSDLEQSKKLAEILPLESADQTWARIAIAGANLDVPEELQYRHNGDMPFQYYSGVGIPCWSLAALFSILPQSITKYIESERCQKTFHLNLFRSYYYCCSYCFSPSISDDDGNNTLYCVGRDNWIDACVAMIIKLHELKML